MTQSNTHWPFKLKFIFVCKRPSSVNKDRKDVIRNRVGVPWWFSGLRIQHCLCCGKNSIPGPGTSTSCGHWKKKKPTEPNNCPIGYTAEAKMGSLKQGIEELSGNPGVFVSASTLHPLSPPAPSSDSTDLLSFHGSQKMTSLIPNCECSGLPRSDLWGSCPVFHCL